MVNSNPSLRQGKRVFPLFYSFLLCCPAHGQSDITRVIFVQSERDPRLSLSFAVSIISFSRQRQSMREAAPKCHDLLADQPTVVITPQKHMQMYGKHWNGEHHNGTRLTVEGTPISRWGEGDVTERQTDRQTARHCCVGEEDIGEQNGLEASVTWVRTIRAFRSQKLVNMAATVPERKYVSIV